MDQFVLRIIGEDDIYKQSFLLMGYFQEMKKKHEIFVKKFGFYLIVIRKVDGCWKMFFHFTDKLGKLNTYTSTKLHTHFTTTDDICKNIAYSENYGFHTLHTGQLIGFE